MKNDFQAADTQVLGVSVDSIHSHGNWASSLGGISYPLLADFHPKGAMAKSYGLYIEEAGITDRGTVIIDKQGMVKYAVTVGPGGERNPQDLLVEAQKINSEK